MEAVVVPEHWISETELARMANTRPSQISTIFKDGRIFEVVRDPENGRKRYPPRACIIPSKYPKPGRKINDLFYDRGDIPDEWIEDPDSRPEPGVILKGTEDDPIGKRIAVTFEVETRNWTADGQEKDRGSRVPDFSSEEDRGASGDLEGLPDTNVGRQSQPTGPSSETDTDDAAWGARGRSRTRGEAGSAGQKRIVVDLDSWREGGELRGMLNVAGLKAMGIDLDVLGRSETIRRLVIHYE